MRAEIILSIFSDHNNIKTGNQLQRENGKEQVCGTKNYVIEGHSVNEEIKKKPENTLRHIKWKHHMPKSMRCSKTVLKGNS